jgi:hypothetical protein
MKQSKLYLHYDGPAGPEHTFIWRSSSEQQPVNWRGVLQAFCCAYAERHPGTKLSALKLALRTAAGDLLTPTDSPFADTNSELQSGADITVIESDTGEAAAPAKAAVAAEAVQAKPELTTLEASNPRDPAIQQVNTAHCAAYNFKAHFLVQKPSCHALSTSNSLSAHCGHSMAYIVGSITH